MSDILEVNQLKSKNLYTDVNECTSNPCKNGGKCKDGVNKYTCTCAAGYSGTTCTTSKYKTHPYAPFVSFQLLNIKTIIRRGWKWRVSCALPFLTNVKISTSISQTFLYWVAIVHLRQHMVYLSQSSYGMPGLYPLMNVLFWERSDFHVSSSGRDMSENVQNRSQGSSMVDFGVSLKTMKSPSTQCYMTFWDMIIYSDILHWSDISLNRDLVTKLDLITVSTLLLCSRAFP